MWHKTTADTLPRASHRPQSQLERRKWPRFGDALNEKEGDSVTVRAVEDIPFERVRLEKSTQEEKKTAVDVATALAMGDKSAVGTRCVTCVLRSKSAGGSGAFGLLGHERLWATRAPSAPGVQLIPVFFPFEESTTACKTGRRACLRCGRPSSIRPGGQT